MAETTKECWNCGTGKTPKWRNSKRWAPGKALCNGCGTQERRGADPIRKESEAPPLEDAAPGVELFECTRCHVPQPIEAFGMRYDGKKRQAQCKKCRNLPPIKPREKKS